MHMTNGTLIFGFSLLSSLSGETGKQKRFHHCVSGSVKRAPANGSHTNLDLTRMIKKGRGGGAGDDDNRR